MKQSFPALVERVLEKNLASIKFHQILTEHSLGALCVLLRKKQQVAYDRILDIRELCQVGMIGVWGGEGCLYITCSTDLNIFPQRDKADYG